MPDDLSNRSNIPEYVPGKLVWSRVNWTVVLGIAVMHIGAVAALFYFSWSALVLAAFFMWVTGGLGITLGFHRLLTHRSFKTPKWFEYCLSIAGSLAWQGGPAQWIGVHRIHHAHSDEEGDPHTPKHGFTWAHVLWCMHKDSDGRRGLDAAKDIMRDPGQRFINNYFYLFQIALIPILYGGGVLASYLGLATSGLSWVLWGICLRTVVVYHVTWFVNSASHTWGYQNFKTGDLSTNLWWVALLSFGEGWHNNHHAYQRSAAHGLKWYEFDLTYWTIRLLSLVGLAHDIVLPDKQRLKSEFTDQQIQPSRTGKRTTVIKPKLPKTSASTSNAA